MNTIKTKICNKCQVEKSIELFSKNKATKDGYRFHCKECEKAYRQANREAIAEQQKAYQKANRKVIAEYYKAYNQTNHEAIAEQTKIYYQANHEVIAIKQKVYREANAEKYTEYKKVYYQANREAIAKCNKAYFQTPMGKAVRKNIGHKRRTIKKQGDVTSAQLLDLQQSAKVCYWCNKSLKGKKIHIDHYIPLSKGGKHTLSNLVVSCSHCNLTKHAKDPIVFAQSIGKLF